MLRKILLFSAGVLIALAGLEIALQLLPVPSATMVGYYIDPAIKTYPPHHRFTVATGWDLKNAQHHETNNFGFVDNRDFKKNPDGIAVIGDSYIEANMLLPELRIGPRLESLLEDRTVYSMGMPGTSLLDYAHRAHFARVQFGIERFVILVDTDDVRQMLCGSDNYARDCVDAQTLAIRQTKDAPDGIVKRVVRNSALAQYLFSQLRIQPVAWLKSLFKPAPANSSAPPQNHAKDPVPPATASKLVERFIEAFPKTQSRPVIVINVSHFSAATEQRNAVQMNILEEKARDAGMDVIRLAPAFDQWTSRSPLSLFVGPYDMHWNATAHQIAAQSVAAVLQKQN